MKMPSELAVMLQRHLDKIVQLANLKCKPPTKELYALMTSGHLNTYQGHYLLSPTRTYRLMVDKLNGLDKRDAREMVRRLASAVDNINMNHQALGIENDKIAVSVSTILNAIKQMDTSLGAMDKISEGLLSSVRSLSCDFENEKSVHIRLFGEGPAKPLPKKRANVIGDPGMAKESINALLNDLRKSKDPDEKRALRVKLRNLGHKGGLGEGRGRPAKGKKTAKKTAKKTDGAGPSED